MTPRSLFPVIITPKILEARDFYTQLLDFYIAFETPWYVQLHARRGENVPVVEIAFMRPDVISQPPQLHAAHSGSGLIVTYEVSSVDELYTRLKTAGALGELIVDLCDEPWGQRHFLFRDPAGLLLDIVQMIPPSAEFDEAYRQE